MVNETYRYLGWGITNENGVAHLDHDADGEPISHSYTGVGAGEIDVVASLDNPIIDGSIVSGTFPVFDCYRHDDGTISSHNDIWTGIINTDLTREAEYTTIKEKTVGTTATITFTGIPFKNYRIECDVFQVDGTRDEWFITVLKEDYSSITSADSKLGEWKHISLDLTNIAPNSRVRLNTGGSCTELRFKNFMLYPYGDNDVISINASNPVIVSNETTNITGSLFIDGVIQKNTNIDVYKNGTKVDTISTGSTGVASYTYTGSGAGATEFQFKYGSILSEPYPVLDTIFYDDGLSGTQTKWDLNLVSKSIESNGTKFLVTDTSAMARASMNPVDNASDYDFQQQPMIFEFDVVDLYLSTGGQIVAQFIQQNPVVNKQIALISSDVGHTIQIRYNGTEIRMYKDGSDTGRYVTCTFDQMMRVGFSFYTKGSYVIVKNVKIYPI